MTAWQNRPQQVVANYIKKVLELQANGQNGQIRTATVSRVCFFPNFLKSSDGATTFGIKTLSITTLSITTFSISTNKS